MQYAIRQGHPIKQIAKMTSIDPWFLYQLKEINDMQLELEKHPMESVHGKLSAKPSVWASPTDDSPASGVSTEKVVRKNPPLPQEA